MTWTLWDHGTEDGCNCISLSPGMEIPHFVNGTPQHNHNIALRRFEADSYDEACARRNELMGWEPYKPMFAEEPLK